MPPLQSVTSITYKDAAGATQTFNAANYIVDTNTTPGRIVLASSASWPGVSLFPVPLITFTFVAGYGAASAVPQRFKTAMGQLIAHWFTTREAVSLIAGANITEIPLTVKELLNQDRMWRF